MIVEDGLDVSRLVQVNCREVGREVGSARVLFLSVARVVGGDQELLVQDRDGDLNRLAHLNSLVVVQCLFDRPFFEPEDVEAVVGLVLLLLVKNLHSSYQVRINYEFNYLLLFDCRVLLVPESLHVVDREGAKVLPLEHEASREALLARLPAHVVTRAGARVLERTVMVVNFVVDYRELLVAVFEVEALALHHAPEAVAVVVSRS